MKQIQFAFACLYGALIISACGEVQTPTESSQPLNKFSDSVLVHIYNLCDKRDAASVAAFLKHEKANYRAEAALAFASMLNNEHNNALLDALNDSETSVRVNASYALGQIASPQIAEKMINAFQLQHSPEVQSALLEAIGKTAAKAHTEANDEVVGKISAFLIDTKPGNEEALTGFFKALFWMHLAGIENSELMDRIPGLIQSAPKMALPAGAHAMLRYKGEWKKEWQQYLQLWIETESEPEIKMIQMGMLPKLEKKDAQKLLVTHAKAIESDERVRVAAVRAFSKIKKAELNVLYPLLNDANDNLVMEILNVFQKAEKPPLTNEYEKYIRSERADVKALLAKLKYASDKNAQVIWDAYNACTKPYDKVHYAHALAVCTGMSNKIFEAMKAEKEFAVKYALTEAFLEQSVTMSNEDFIEKTIEALEISDMGVTSLFASALQTRTYENIQIAMLYNALKAELNATKLPEEIETYNELIRAINYLKVEKLEEKTVDYNHPIDWQMVVKIPAKQQVRITTNKGEMIVQLNVEDAPGTVAGFLKLASEGFFNGKYFHRVIPNFVAQGGCPRGDGMGSTAYTIRSEFACHRYIAGAVGMASSGHDTEGCQWFVTHCYTPHLEGRYTIFGYVTSGLQVLNQIIIGDTIQKIEII